MLHQFCNTKKEVVSRGVNQPSGGCRSSRDNRSFESCSSRPVEPIKEIPLIADFLNRIVRVGTKLTAEIKNELITLIHEYANIFAWDPKDMPGILAEIALQCLNLKPEVYVVKQKK